VPTTYLAMKGTTLKGRCRWKLSEVSIMGLGNTPTRPEACSPCTRIEQQQYTERTKQWKFQVFPSRICLRGLQVSKKYLVCPKTFLKFHISSANYGMLLGLLKFPQQLRSFWCCLSTLQLNFDKVIPAFNLFWVSFLLFGI